MMRYIRPFSQCFVRKTLTFEMHQMKSKVFIHSNDTTHINSLEIRSKELFNFDHLIDYYDENQPRTLFSISKDIEDLQYIVKRRINTFSNLLGALGAFGADFKYTNSINYKKIGRRNKMRYNMETNLNYLRDYAIKYAFTNISSKVHTQVKLTLDPNSMMSFIKWLKQFDSRYKTRISRISKGNYVFRTNDYFIKIDSNTFARIRTGDAIKSSLYDIDIINNTSIGVTDIYIDIIGKRCFKVAQELEELVKIKYTVCYKITAKKQSSYGRGSEDEVYNTDVYYNELNGRSKNTIFLNKDVKESIFRHIDTFIENESTYKNRNLLYKTGILLYGAPGTGKTSIANMICSEYNKNMVLINMSEFKNIDIDFVTSTINADNKMYVVVLEDIDFVIGNREENSESEMRKNINKLLQFLDSSSSPTNVIFVATTNHPDKLDSAITRSGRFDLKVEIGNIEKDVALEMCKSFGLSRKVSENIWDKNNENNLINPANLQNLILEALGGKAMDLSELDTSENREDKQEEKENVEE